MTPVLLPPDRNDRIMKFMELFNTATPEKAFKTSVRPLAGLLVFQSLGLLYIFVTWPADRLYRAPLPFSPDQLKQYVLIAAAILILVTGLGLFFRSRLLWYLFMAYLVLGPCWLIFGVAFDYFPAIGIAKEILLPLLACVSALLAWGLYVVTKPAFQRST